MTEPTGPGVDPQAGGEAGDALLDDWCGGKVAIVTGAARGIGFALSRLLIDHGAAGVTLVDLDYERLGSATARFEETARTRILTCAADVTDQAAMDTAVRATIERFGRIDLLVNNAGAPFVGAFDDLGIDDWDRAFALNFHAPMNGLRAVLPTMRRQHGGTVVNVISGMAFMPMAFQSMYAATKAALNAATLALRTELWDEGIRLVSATPGTTATEIWGDVGRAPSTAQSADVSARSILRGAARNERLVLGDEPDRRGAKRAFDPDVAGAVDEYLLDVARGRRDGTSAI